MPLVVKKGDIWIAQVSYENRHIAKNARFQWDAIRKIWWTSDISKAAILDPTLLEKTKKVIELSKAKDIQDSRIVNPPDGLEYLPFQRVAISYGLSRNNVLLGDAMGLGKTWEAIGIINSDLSIKTVLIICPNSLKLNWERELKRVLARSFKIKIAYSKDFPKSFDILIINYDICKRYETELKSIKWDCLILDEAHYCKHIGAQRTKVIMGYKKEKGIEAKRRLYLTGTPIPNRPIEGWTLFHSLAPSIFSSWWEYANRYCAAHNNGFGLDTMGASHLDELQNKLRSSILVRRRKEEVLEELPAKRRTVVEVPPNGIQKIVQKEIDAYDSHLKNLASLKAKVELAKSSNDEKVYEKAVERLRDASSAMFSEIAQLRHQTALAKVPFVISFLEDLLEEEGTKVVCFAHHHDVIAQIVDHFGNKAVHLTGEDKIEDRQSSVDRFQNDPTCTLFIGSITAAGVGITLTASSNVVFAELDWVPGNCSQAEDRLHRIGQREMVLVQHIVIDGSLDARMAKILVSKQKVIDEALDVMVQREQSKMPLLAFGSDGEGATEGISRKSIQEEAKKIPPSHIPVIHDGLKIIASYDEDHASSLNAVGFNRMDTKIGHSLAAADNLTSLQAALGLKIIHKYRKQLPSQLIEKLGIL